MYDSKCYDLAEHFLRNNEELNTEDNKKRLAQEIQAAIESWLDWEAAT